MSVASGTQPGEVTISDPYQVLGVPRSATQDQVRAAYQRVWADGTTNESERADAWEAGQILGDLQRRAQHDHPAAALVSARQSSPAAPARAPYRIYPPIAQPLGPEDPRWQREGRNWVDWVVWLAFAAFAAIAAWWVAGAVGVWQSVSALGGLNEVLTGVDEVACAQQLWGTPGMLFGERAAVGALGERSTAERLVCVQGRDQHVENVGAPDLTFCTADQVVRDVARWLRAGGEGDTIDRRLLLALCGMVR